MPTSVYAANNYTIVIVITYSRVAKKWYLIKISQEIKVGNEKIKKKKYIVYDSQVPDRYDEYNE